MIDKELLDLLVCPLTREKLQLDGDMLVNDKLGLKYPIRNGVPVLLAEHAQLPDDIDSLDELKQKIAHTST